MSTGVESFANLDQAGAIYPMVGTEGVLVLIGVAIWIIWHIWQTCIENNEHQKDIENARTWNTVRTKSAQKQD